jgi:trehalose-phosphatase
MTVSLPLQEHLATLKQRLMIAPHWLLFADFDGTLTPIVDHPDKASLSSDIRELLRVLARRANTTVAIVSGRALAEVRERVDLPELIYSGNHGIEIEGPDYRFVHPSALARQEPLSALAASLDARLQDVSGAWVEKKTFSLSVHARKVEDADRQRVHDVVTWCVNEFLPSLELTIGKMVFEIRPRLDWNKGSAALWIKEHVGITDALTVYLGDDRTDEDAFEQLRGGINVKVGPHVNSHADYFVDSPREVTQFLGWLIDVA